MNCHRCGNVLPTNASSCAHCNNPLPKTKRLVESDYNKTRALVQVERCANCGFLVFAGDSECQSCGTWIDRAWQKSEASAGAGKTGAGNSGKKWVLVGVAVSIVLLGLTAIVWRMLSGQ